MPALWQWARSLDRLHRAPGGRGRGHRRWIPWRLVRNALAESVTVLYKSEVIFNRGSWRTVDDVELALAPWVL